MDLANEQSDLSSISDNRFAKAANIVNIVSRLAGGAPSRQQSSKHTLSSLFFSASAKSLSSEAPDPKTLRFIYSKAVNRALDDYAIYANAGNLELFCVGATEISIEKLPEIYDSMIFMGQTQPVPKRKRRNLRIKKKELSTMDTLSTLTYSVAPSAKRTVQQSNRTSRVTLPPISNVSSTRTSQVSLKRSRKSIVLPNINTMTPRLR